MCVNAVICAKRAVLPVSYLLLANSAGLFFCDDTFNLLVEDSLFLYLKAQVEARSNQLQHLYVEPTQWDLKMAVRI